MFFENELTGSLPFARLLLVLLLGLSPVVVTILIKRALHRRLIAEDLPPAQQEHKTLAIEGTLEEFALALANGIANFRDPRRFLEKKSKFGSYSVAGWR